MAQESEHPTDDSPQFNDSPIDAQAGTAQPAGPSASNHPDHDDPPPPQAEAKPKTATPAHDQPHDSPKVSPGEKTQPSRPAIISGAVMMVVGSAITIGTFLLARAYAPPKPPGEVSSDATKDMVKQEDFKKLSDRVDHMAMDVDQAKKQIADRPDYSNQIKMDNDRINELSQTVTQMPAQFDSINQRLGTLSKMEDANSSSRVDGIDKRVEDLSKSIEAIRAGMNSSPRRSGNAGASAGSSRVEDVNIEGLAMEQAVELFNAKKYTEAKDAFMKLQAVFPNDARVWYYSALANGFSTGKWLGETERMVETGLDKEKAGQPSTAKVDAIFANLTPSTGRDWLAGYRKRIGAQ